MNLPQWLDAFGPSADVPAVLSADPRLQDVSWHNDVCPSFVAAPSTYEGAGADEVRLWADFPDKARSEYPTCARFRVCDNHLILFQTDDVADLETAIGILLTATAARIAADRAAQ